MTTTSVRTVLMVMVVACASAPASAEDVSRRPAGPLSPGALQRVVHENGRRADGVLLSRQSGSAPRKRKDSILDGGLIGAAIGGVGGSALIVAASGGSDDIPRAMLNVAALPALGGFALGALVDALR